MYNIVTYGKLVKVSNRLTVVLLLSALLIFLFLSEYITFGNDNKLNYRIFKTFVYVAVSYHNLAFNKSFVIILAEI